MLQNSAIQMFHFFKQIALLKHVSKRKKKTIYSQIRISEPSIFWQYIAKLMFALET